MSTATIKYYLRSGLLPAAVIQSSTWATYDERHLRRLRLIRALTDVAGLSLAEVRRVSDALAAAESDHEARGIVQWSLSPPVAAPPSAGAIDRVEALLARQHWQVGPDSPHRPVLAAALDTLDELGFPPSEEILDAYAAALQSVAEREVAHVGSETDPLVAAERLVVGTLLYEPLLVTLRRMAHEAVSARSTGSTRPAFGDTPPG